MRITQMAIGLVVGLAVLAGCSSTPAEAQQPQAGPAAATLRLPAIFGDHMVLQQGKPVPVWGWARPGQTVAVEFAGQKKTATAGAHGKWMVRLDALKAGGPHEMLVSLTDEPGGGRVRYANVLVGEVWICSGQSNMEWPLRATNDADAAIASATNPKLRLFTVQKAQADSAQSDCKGQWQQCTPQNVPGFSAVGYHFGRQLQQALNVPVGLIHTSWGGTPIEVWTSRNVFDSDPESNKPFADAHEAGVRNYARRLADYEAAMVRHRQAVEQARKDGKPAPAAPRRPQVGMAPSCLYNAMIAPLLPYGVGGAIWYQGESNAGRAIAYRKQFPAMIRNWREDFGQEFPFLFVQLANYMQRESQPSDPDWAYLREAQTLTLATPRTGMAVTIDIGEANDIHPRNKLDVGRRLALAAQAVAYGKDIVYSGPMYDSMTIEADKAILKFKHVGGGLVAREGTLKGFAIAGADRKFVWADARIDGDTVVVSSEQVKQPVAVRYAWANNPECNLYNKEGLPASPFRTDAWERGR